MKNVTLMLVVCVIALKANAQSNTDALRYSQLTFGGTARGMGIAGAVGSLGADITDLSVNPAGIGLYRSSEIEITPSLFMISDATNYLGASSTTDKSNFNLTNFGAVFTHKIRSRRNTNSPWKTTSFGIAYNRLNNFNENFYFQGNNSNNSITDAWAQQLNGTDVSQAANFDQFGASLAYDDYLVNPVSSNQYAGTAPSGGVTQTESDQLSGSQNEFDISFGANYNDKLFLGITVGIPTINYNLNSEYTEVSNNSVPTAGDFQSLDYNYQLSTSGTGVNVKFGVIYKVNDFLRLGVAAHTPTWYNMSDSYASALTGVVDSAGSIINYYNPSPYGSFDYNLVTPWRFVGSATILFKQYGFISADYEYVDYSQAYFDYSSSGDLTDQNNVNRSIQNAFAPASIFRVGAEFAYDIFRIRGGFAYYGSPLQSNIIANTGNGTGTQSVDNITGGVGLRLDHVFIDAAYVYSMINSSYYPYTVDPSQSPYTSSPFATVKNTTGNIILTIGYKF